jgi:hypothetical protein
MSSAKTNLKVLISSALLIATIFLTVQIISLSKENQLLGGFYLFLFFCLASLVLSEALTRRSPPMN